MTNLPATAIEYSVRPRPKLFGLPHCGSLASVASKGSVATLQHGRPHKYIGAPAGHIPPRGTLVTELVRIQYRPGVSFTS